MIASILAWLASLAIRVISGSGYLGVMGLMALESACIPIPSEVIMPFAGYLVTTGRFSLFWIIILGTIGNLIGSLVAYAIGVYGGRPFIVKYGKYIFISQEELNRAEGFFKKHGDLSVFFSRLLPIIRTFISLPAGIARMHFWKFSFYTLIGSLFWSALLSYIGFFLGSKWQIVQIYFKRFDWLIGILLIAGIVYFLYKNFRKKK